MYSKNTLRWIDLLPFVTESYNTRRKPGLGNLSPKLAQLPKNIEFLKNFLLERKKNYESQFSNQKIKFELNDLVKIVKPKTPFSRGYTQKYGDQTYRIEKIHTTWPVTFSLYVLKPTFYTEQLIKVPEQTPNTLYIAETKKIPDSFLRTGKIISYKIMTLIKDKNNPNYSEWKTEDEIRKMKKDDLLAPSMTLPK